jgi:hypothetical protein
MTTRAAGHPPRQRQNEKSGAVYLLSDRTAQDPITAWSRSDRSLQGSCRLAAHPRRHNCHAVAVISRPVRRRPSWPGVNPFATVQPLHASTVAETQPLLLCQRLHSGIYRLDGAVLPTRPAIAPRPGNVHCQTVAAGELDLRALGSDRAGHDRPVAGGSRIDF